MKRKFIIFIVVVTAIVVLGGGGLALNGYFGGGAGSEALATDSLTRGLVGYWNFDEGAGQTASDSSDSNNDGTLGASSSEASDDPTWTSGKAGNGGALDFDVFLKSVILY